MAVQDLLSQDEIDALLNGVDSGKVETEAPPEPCAAVLQAAIAEASAILGDAEQRLETGAAAEVQA